MTRKNWNKALLIDLGRFIAQCEVTKLTSFNGHTYFPWMWNSVASLMFLFTDVDALLFVIFLACDRFQKDIVAFYKKSNAPLLFNSLFFQMVVFPALRFCLSFGVELSLPLTTNLSNDNPLNIYMYKCLLLFKNYLLQHCFLIIV